MFKSTLIDIKMLGGGSCKVPRGSRGDDVKTTRKNKDRATNRLTHKLELNVFQQTGNYSQEDKEDNTTALHTTQDAIISTSYMREQINDRIKSFDVISV